MKICKCKHCGIEFKAKKGAQCQTCRNGIARYGLTRLDQIKMLEEQKGCCALCGKSVELFNRRKRNSGYVDHCHTTGSVRSILCHPCNTTLGYIESNLSLERLEAYLFSSLSG